jgi:Ca2+-binding RTX toxin-like protein
VLISIGACLAAGPAAGATPGIGASLGKGTPAGAAASGAQTTILTLDGTAVASRTTVFVDGATGELVVREATQVTSPGDPCTPAAGTPTAEFRCPAGAIGAIIGDLDLGADRFVVARSVTALIGAVVGGQQRPMRGGGGNDRIFGGRVGDFLVGAAGRDRLTGRGGGDLLRGGRDRDSLSGGPAGDALFGNAGADLLLGGRGRDLCVGGRGSDGFVSCALGG